MSSIATLSAGAKFRAAVAAEKPLQLVGAINANHALLAKHAGFKAIYLSGGGVSAGSLGLPDLGISTLDDVLTDVRRITDVCDLPLMVDVDTGFGPSAFNIARTVKSLIKAGAGAMHIEDQVGAKRCGHRPGKAIVSALRGSTSINTSIGLLRDCVSRGESSKLRMVGSENPACANSLRAAASSLGWSRAIQLATTKSVLKA